jgi:pSer/pThr/pTyr-binding forkhead associated (FHA) protein
LDSDQTRIMTAADRAESALERALHSLELIDGLYLGRRYLIAHGGATLGRSAPADIVLPESEVSRAHCRISVEGEDLVVTDLGSTNGTFVGGARVTEPTVLPVGGVLTVGRQSLRRLGGEDARAPVAPPDIFLSYNREDQVVARRFAEAFAELGFSVWWDVTLRAGQAYDEVTEAALRAAKAVVVLWSKRSVASRWVRAEATLGDRNGTLLPAMIEPCERPVMFELTQTANLSHWQGEADDPAWLAFIEDVRRRVGVSVTESGG